MFVPLYLFSCLVASVYALERGDFQKYGLFNIALNSPMFLKCQQDRHLNLDVSRIKIHFYDFGKNLHTSFFINDAAESILNIKDLDKTKQIVLFVGGFTSHIDHAIEKQMREAYKNHPNIYFMIPDHSTYTNNLIGSIRGYERSVKHIHYIGKALGQMLAALNRGGVYAENVHCVGHSLGGQILGHVGSTFSELTGKKISRITALDPAGPCFANSEVENQVRSGVAEYVEVYHCNAGALGSSRMLGDVDFIVNGETQPNCDTPLLPVIYASSKSAACAHRACVDLWTASVKTPGLFMAYKCDSYDNFREGYCLTNEKSVAGFGSPGKAKGMFYFSTTKYELKSFM